MDSLTGMSDDVPAGTEDFVTEVRAYGDRFVPATPVGAADLATAVRPTGSFVRGGRGPAAALDLRKGDRVLVHAADETPVTEWLRPAAGGGSIVLLRNGDRRADRADRG